MNPPPSYFYPRPPRGGRLINGFQMAQVQLFLSTPSARRATARWRQRIQDRPISIHALREEGDSNTPVSLPPVQHFYPRPPRGGRLAIISSGADGAAIFLSTPSARRATQSEKVLHDISLISIHALREEGDFFFGNVGRVSNEFLSTPSARRATAKTEKNISAFVSL